jgi:hypothetical protein
VPAALYAAWYLAYGHTGIAALRSPSLDGVAAYAGAGLASAAAGALGTMALVAGGLAIVALAVGLVATRPVPSVVLAQLVAGVAFYVNAGTVRAELGPEQATAPRYVYIVAPAFIVSGAIVLARLPRPRGAQLGAVLLAIALVGNIGLLVARHDRFLTMIACERSMTPLARGSAGNPC